MQHSHVQTWPPVKAITAVVSRFRPLPTCIIVGAMKCGTSSLYSWLKQHPKVRHSSPKEIHFFDRPKLARDLSWYRAHFPVVYPWESVGCVLEATPSYMYRKGSIERMASVVPSAKLIVLLRDPVQRAISHYRHRCDRNRERRSPCEALLEEKSDGTLNDYVHRGLYAEQLDGLYQHWDKRRILTIRSEDMFADPGRIYCRALQFLNLDPQYRPPSFQKRNQSAFHISIPLAVEHRLQQFFLPYNCQLSSRLPEDFKMWNYVDL